MIPYGKTFRDFRDEGLNKAGTKIRMGKDTLLIGDINEVGGYCDDCSVNQYDIVDEYEQIC